jgi:phosphatidylserine/phosphatidylglycerophosphate/cardiolipin synthase-like enzyme
MSKRSDVLFGVILTAFAAWAMAANFGAPIGRVPVASRAADVGAAPVEIHYAPRENLERIDVALIDSAGESIDIAAYVLTDWAVIDALADAAERGVKVRVWRESSTAGYSDRDEIAKLAAAGAEVRIKPPGDLMHLKSYCVDGATLRAGAANFSTSGLKRQDNDLLIVRGPNACDRFEAAFAAMWKEAE